MTKSTITKVTEIIREQGGLGGSREIKDTDLLLEDFSMDSIDCIEMVMAIEEDFKLEIPDADACEFKTVGDVIAYVEGRVE